MSMFGLTRRALRKNRLFLYVLVRTLPQPVFLLYCYRGKRLEWIVQRLMTEGARRGGRPTGRFMKSFARFDRRAIRAITTVLDSCSS